MPKGTRGGDDEAVVQKDKFCGMFFKFNDYKINLHCEIQGRLLLITLQLPQIPPGQRRIMDTHLADGPLRGYIRMVYKSIFS